MSEVRLRASIVVIGDEILGGFVQDTNSGWLAGRLHAAGVPLERIATVPDALDAIQEAIDAELARVRPRLLLTSGGIGSTPDDVTMEAVAAYLGQDLVVDPDIDQRVTRALEWTASQGVTLSAAHEQAMRKMSLVPEEAYLLDGTGGLTPGVAADVDGGCDTDGGATIVILPGVPSELRRITTGSIEPQLLAGRGLPQHVEELTHPYPESVLNEVFHRLVAEFPDVHLGSYPGPECIVRLKGDPDRVGAAMAIVREAVARLEADPGAARLRAAWADRNTT